MKRTILFLGVTALLTTMAADRGWKLPPETTKLERREGLELITAQCLLCHSADYISTQPRLNRAAWNAIVVKMKDKYGAPIQPEHIDRLVDYLVKSYGSERGPTK
jgi:sulfite dehydrogenase (cytochrome) subunit B